MSLVITSKQDNRAIGAADEAVESVFLLAPHVFISGHGLVIDGGYTVA